MRRYRALSSPPGAFCAGQFWADCITNTAGPDFRQAQYSIAGYIAAMAPKPPPKGDNRDEDRKQSKALALRRGFLLGGPGTVALGLI